MTKLFFIEGREGAAIHYKEIWPEKFLPNRRTFPPCFSSRFPVIPNYDKAELAKICRSSESNYTLRLLFSLLKPD
jgi:hypothetical protein